MDATEPIDLRSNPDDENVQEYAISETDDEHLPETVPDACEEEDSPAHHYPAASQRHTLHADVPAAHEQGLEYGANAPDIAADNMAAHIAAAESPPTPSSDRRQKLLAQIERLENALSGQENTLSQLLRNAGDGESQHDEVLAPVSQSIDVYKKMICERKKELADLDDEDIMRQNEEAARQRWEELPAAKDSGAQEFANALADKLRAKYRDGGEDPPLQEEAKSDAAGHSFHEHIEAAVRELENDEDPAGEYAKKYSFKRERTDDYHNPRGRGGKQTNPDFCSCATPSRSVIEAKMHLSGEFDRYKGQQCKYLASPEVACVILLVLRHAGGEPCLRKRLEEQMPPGAMKAVAIGVVLDDDEGTDDHAEPPDESTDDHAEPPDEMDDAVAEGLEDGENDTLTEDGMDDANAEAIEDGVELPQELQSLWKWLQRDHDKPPSGNRSILEQCFFDVPEYMKRVHCHLHGTNTVADDGVPAIFAGGSTQMGKTMFVVIGACVARCLGVASIVITTKVAGRNELAQKVSDAFNQLLLSAVPEMDPDDMFFECASYAAGDEERTRLLKRKRCVVVSDTVAQILDSTRSMYNTIHELQKDAEDKLRFVLFKDEADSMLRTEDERLRLEEGIKKLGTTQGTYRGPTLIISITATLMPCFLELQRLYRESDAHLKAPFLTSTKEPRARAQGLKWKRVSGEQLPRHANQLTSPTRLAKLKVALNEAMAGEENPDIVTLNVDKWRAVGERCLRTSHYVELDDGVNYMPSTIEYVGVDSFRPCIAASEDATEVFLDPGLIRGFPDLGINKQVHRMFKDLTRSGGRKGLLLDISLNKVYIRGGLFDKAKMLHDEYEQLHVLVYCGKGVVVGLAESFRDKLGRKFVLPRKRKSSTVHLPTPFCLPMSSDDATGLVWYTNSPNSWNNDDGFNIGPKKLTEGWLGKNKKLRPARPQEVLHALDEVFFHVNGHANDPIAILGYHMMARGQSFVTTHRKPTHLVLHMYPSASFDLLVQSAGRATFLDKEKLKKNGWVDDAGEGVVRVLMPEEDFKSIQEYPKLVEEICGQMKNGKTVKDLLGDVNGPLYGRFDALVKSRRNFGDRRKNYPKKSLGERADDSDDSNGKEALEEALKRLGMPGEGDSLWFDDNEKVLETIVKHVEVDPLDPAQTEQIGKDDLLYDLETIDDRTKFQRRRLGPVRNNWWRLPEDVPEDRTVQETLSNKKKNELLKIARERGLRGVSNLKKADIIARLKAARTM